MPEAATLCPYCGVGCGLLVEVREGRVARVRGDPAHPSSLGDLCAKAVHLPPTLRTDDRLLYPHLRSRRDAALSRVPWDLAIRTVADRLGEIVAAHGPGAIAFYASGQLTTEEYYVAGKLAKGFLGTNNFDTNSRLCMASAAVGYTRTFGADGPPCSYEDVDAADVFLLIGTNTADCHPVLFKRLRRRKAAAPDDVGVIVADPRWTETPDLADLHLALRPGSDVALLNGMLHVLAREGLLDRDFIAAHTTGWGAVERAIAACRRERAAILTGLSAEAIVAAALAFGRARRALTLWSMGVNQSRIGTDKTAAILNLHLATGQIGRAGAGPFSLTGQPNAMGGRETGGLAHLLPGYRSIGDAAARAVVERHWGVEPGTIQPEPVRAAPGGPRDRAGRVSPDGDDAVRRRAAAGRPVAREGRRHDELRAPADVPAEARPTAGRGAARRRDRHARRGRDGLQGLVRIREHGGDLRRVRGADGRAALRLLGGEPLAAARARRAVAGAHARASRPRPALRRRRLSDRRRSRALRARRPRRARRAPRPRVSADPHDGPRARSLAHADADRASPCAARAHARADRRGQRRRRAARGDPGRRLRGGRLAPRQADRPVPRDLGHPRRRLLRAVPLGAPPGLLQERQQPHAERARSAVASAGAQGMRGAPAPRGVTIPPGGAPPGRAKRVNRIEAMKAEKDGLDVQEDLVRFAREGWKTLA